MTEQWKLQTIKILVNEGEQKRVWALVNGNLAIHNTTIQIFNKTHLERGRFNVTHIPTGLRCSAASLEKSELAAAVERARAAEWRHIRIADMPACEIATVLPVMWQELRPDLDNEYEAEFTVGALKKVYGC